ncbi:hypothetical protein Y032_0379g322 [Ancylostoma ceylanicum]|uniref:Uncharacterized protein n=1 Tax=Ancylostoma ceylanicum TaxID=53326 RepID=A0A016RU22_9BILA|nr:hypothetical protein Y032_0379g322 [Ancylostoma ceylanicum]
MSCVFSGGVRDVSSASRLIFGRRKSVSQKCLKLGMCIIVRGNGALLTTVIGRSTECANHSSLETPHFPSRRCTP